MSLEESLNQVEGEAFTVSEYDTLVIAALNGGLVESPDLESLTDEDLPPALMDWIRFCERVRMDYAILHLVLAGVLVPTQPDDVESEYPGYRYVKSDMASAIIENLGVGKL